MSIKITSSIKLLKNYTYYFLGIIHVMSEKTNLNEYSEYYFNSSYLVLPTELASKK